MIKNNSQTYCSKPEHFEQLLSAKNTLHLLPHFLSLKTDIKLWDGDKKAAREWLLQDFIYPEPKLTLEQLNLYFTTVRALITEERLDEAIFLSKRVHTLTLSSSKIIAAAESEVLLSIALWRKENQSDAKVHLLAAIKRLYPHKCLRPVTIEGRAVLPILKKLCADLKHGTVQVTIEESFINELLFAAAEQSKRRQGLYHSEKQIHLSHQQQKMLQFISQGYTQKAIAVKTGLALPTVKTHLAEVYRKLDVHTGIDAVIKANNLDLLD